MASRKYKSKGFRKTKSRKTRKTRRRRGGLSLFRDPQCYLGYDNVKNIVDGDYGGNKVSSLSAKCNCRPDSQKSTCINLADIKRKSATSNASSDLKNTYY